MTTLVTYSLNSGLALLTLWAITRVLLSHCANHRASRAVLLSCYLFAALSPLSGLGRRMEISRIAEITPLQIVAPIAITNPSPETLAQHPSLPTAAREILTTLSIPNVVTLLYFTGMAVVSMWLLICWIKIASVIRGGKKERSAEFILIIAKNRNITPFSFWRYIVVSPAERPETLPTILRHEQAHFRARHWLDLILAQFVIVFQWWNPAAWLMLRDLKTVHEFQADAFVLASGTDKTEYQLLLLSYILRPTIPANTFSGNIKSRIKMMGRKRNSSLELALLLLMLPAFLLAANMPKLSQSFNESTKVLDSENHEPIVIKLDDFPRILSEHIIHKIKISANIPKVKCSAKVGFAIYSDGKVSEIELVESSGRQTLDDEAIRVISELDNVYRFSDVSPGTSLKFLVPITFSTI